MKKFKALLTDMDDTLFKSKKAYREHGLKTIYEIFNENGSSIKFDKFRKVYEQARMAVRRELVGTAAVHNRAIINQKVLEYLGLEFDASLLKQMTEEFYQTVYDLIELYEAVSDTLHRIRAEGIMIVGVSDTELRVQLDKISKLGISKYFDAIVTSDEAGHEKPHPAIFLLALNKIGVTSKDVVYVGDDPQRDIEGANSLGMTTIQAVMRGDKTVATSGIQKPNFTVESYKDILNILL